MEIFKLSLIGKWLNKNNNNNKTLSCRLAWARELYSSFSKIITQRTLQPWEETRLDLKLSEEFGVTHMVLEWIHSSEVLCGLYVKLRKKSQSCNGNLRILEMSDMWNSLKGSLQAPSGPSQRKRPHVPEATELGYKSSWNTGNAVKNPRCCTGSGRGLVSSLLRFNLVLVQHLLATSSFLLFEMIILFCSVVY